MFRKAYLMAALGFLLVLLVSNHGDAQELSMKPTPTPTPLSVPTTGPGSIPHSKAILSAPTKVTPASLAISGVSLVSLSTGTPPKIIGTSGGSIYDLNALTGTGSNYHLPRLSGMAMHQFVGIAYAGNNAMWGLTVAYSPQMYPYRSRLFTIDALHDALGIGPSLTLAGNPFVCGKNGDIAYDNAAGKMYATCFDGVWKLITISLGNGSVTIVGTMPVAGPGAEFSALAFSPAGELYALDTYSRKLWKLNKANLSGSTAIPLVPAPGQQLSNTSETGGMGFSAPGGLYASFGGDLVTIHPVSGVATVFGHSGSSGLIVSGGSGPVKHN